MERNENICRQTIKQTDTNLITEAHSNPLWIVGERANNVVFSTLLTTASDNSSVVLSSLCINTSLCREYWIKLATLGGQQRPREVASLFILHLKDTFLYRDEALVFLHFYQRLNVLH